MICMEMSSCTPTGVRLRKDDLQYMSDYTAHRRNIYGRDNPAGIDPLDAQLYESIKTSLTALKYLVEMFNLQNLSIELNRDVPRTTVEVAIRDLCVPEGVSEVYFRIGYTIPENCPNGIFIGEFRLVPAFEWTTVFSYPVNTENLMAYDMVFPMPSVFRMVLSECALSIPTEPVCLRGSHD